MSEPLCSRPKETRAIGADPGKQLEGLVAKLVESGRCKSKSEVLREGVWLIQAREARLAALDVAIARGLADENAGRRHPAGAAFERLEAGYRALIPPGE